MSKLEKAYVLGFAFSKDKNHVVLIEKQRPDWQKGCFNGVGGKIEPEDGNPFDAMTREFFEETGVATSVVDWSQFAEMIFDIDEAGNKGVVYCFRLNDDLIFDCKTMEDEQIHILCINGNSFLGYENLIGKPCLKNLKVLLPMAEDEDFNKCELNVL